ncbi:MAG: sigma-70 family RNA polymerase sigma factor [Cypionkella sp.]|nr:sigma-70 family RNA polymerase sigma factor [Cypionkella sp.]
MNTIDLNALLIRIAAQDRAAFSAFYSAAAPKLFGLLIRIMGNRAEAEDALQEVFTRIWLRAARFDPDRGGAMAWAVTIARNHAIDLIRARRPLGDEVDLDSAADPAPRAETQLIAQGEAGRIQNCLSRLDPAVARAIRGAYLSGHSYADLAKAANVPLNTLRTWLRRGLISLKDCMQ